MGFFTPSKSDMEELREVKDHELSTLSNEKIIMLALSVLLDLEGEDTTLSEELKRRVKRL